MEIKITKSGQGSKVINDDGSEVGYITRINVSCALNQATKADIELLCLSADIELDSENVSFFVAGHKDIVALVDKNGNQIPLTVKKYLDFMDKK